MTEKAFSLLSNISIAFTCIMINENEVILSFGHKLLIIEDFDLK